MTESTPLPRLIPRREVLAFVALTGDEASMSHMVWFREYCRGDRDWRVIALDVDSEAAVRLWAGVFGHEATHLTEHHHTDEDGRRWTSYNSQGHGWRGFTTEVRASVEEPADIPFDDATRARLAEIADPTDREVPSP